jgi:hypothetical protein
VGGIFEDENENEDEDENEDENVEKSLPSVIASRGRRS